MIQIENLFSRRRPFSPGIPALGRRRRCPSGAVTPDQPQPGLLGGDVIQRGIPRGEEAVEDLEDLAEFLSPGGLDEAVAGHRCR
jgi:hypothetical protein